VVGEEDQVLAIMKSGKVIRSNVNEVKRTGRTTQGVTLAKPDKGDEILSIARNEESEDDPQENDGQPVTEGTSTESAEIVQKAAE
jgi:DNA gyrase subunit A